MSSAALLRPGSAIGAYPQREDIRVSWLDRAADNVAGFLRQHVYGRSLRYQAFIDTVNNKSIGLDGVEDEVLKARVTRFRKRLYSEGLKDELVAESFAMVREMTSRRLHMRQYDDLFLTLREFFMEPSDRTMFLHMRIDASKQLWHDGMFIGN